MDPVLNLLNEQWLLYRSRVRGFIFDLYIQIESVEIYDR